MHWQKHGLIIKPQQELWWSKTHAMIPTPYQITDDIYRIYYSGRNALNQSHIGWCEVNLNDPATIINRSKEPVLSPGKLGCFDDNGVTPSCVIPISKNELALYYIGWNPGSTVRMHLFGGLAISRDNGETFQRWSEAPIIERSPKDPYLNTAPWVVATDEGFRMFYVSGVEWVHKDLPRYNIKTAFSKDGKSFERNGEICIDFSSKEENALARPFVMVEEGVWKMWFAHKGHAYQLGYAESNDGVDWQRMDEQVGIKSTEGEFDSEMIEYASVIKHKSKYFMFYNGNNYGYDGIGLAIGS